MNRLEAEKICKHVAEMFDSGNKVLYVANNSDDLTMRKNTQQAMGVVIAELGLEILERLYKQHPDLRPPEHQ
jgi:UDP-2,3-diacylglucosamine pyrophosphatase LpxH